VQVRDAVGNVLFASNSAAISRTAFTRFEFAPALSADQITIRVDARNLGGLNDDIGMDNIRFSQSGDLLCLPSPAGQVAIWRGEGNALDGVSTNHGVLQNGAGFAPGFVGQAFQFDGANDLVQVTDAPELNPTNITLEAWVNPTQIKAGSRIISKDIDDQSCESPYVVYSLDLRADRSNRLAFFFTTVGTTNLHEVIGTSVIPTNAFTHVAATFDGVVAKVFVNGAEEASLSVAGNLIASTAPLVIGAPGAACRTAFAGLAEFNGRIDEISLYDRALTAGEIATIVNGSKCAPGENPDTDGDGLPDLFEFTHHFDPRANDAGLDADGDGLTNLAEFQQGTDPHNPDTDGDGLPDGTDNEPLIPNVRLAIAQYATVTDPMQLAFAPDGTLFAGRDNTGSGGTTADAVKIHRIGPGGVPVVEHGNAAIDDPDAVAFDATGGISGVAGSALVGHRSAARGFISAVRPDQTVAAVFGPSTQFGNPGTLKIDRNGRLLFSEGMVAPRGIWASSGGSPALLLSLPGGALPIHFAFGADNRIFISDEFGVLRIYDSNGALLNGSLATGLTNFVFDVGPGGFFGTNLWGVDQQGRILEVNTVSGATVVHAVGLNRCVDALFGPDGALYLSQFEDDRILRILPECSLVPNGIVSLWGSDGDALDSISAHHGTLQNGAGFIGGKAGQAFNLDGVNDFIEVGNPAELQPASGEFTITGWIMVPDTPDNADVCEARYPIFGFAWGYSVEVNRQRQLAFTKYTNRNSAVGVSAAPAISTNVFHHFAAVHTPAEMRLYLDGELIGTTALAQSNVYYEPGDTLKIGARDCGPTRFAFKGRIDELAMFNRALDVSEIQSLHSTGSASRCAPDRDTDGDRMPDAFELAHNLNPLVNDAALDPDADILTNLQEFRFGTLPRLADSDNDGASDGNEAFGGFSMAAWWRAEENTLGTLNGGAGFASGVLGRAFSFDGMDDSVSVPDDALHRLQTFSLEAWIRTAGIQESALAGFIVAKSGPGGNDGFELAVGTPAQSGTVRFTMNNGQNGADMFGTTSVTNGTFHHVVATYDGTNMALYVDGQLDAQKAAAVTVSYPAGIPLYIGRREHSTIPGFFPGQIDELTIYRSALTAAQVTNLFLAGGLGSIGKGSHPLDPDTDDDGILDGIDPNPFTSNADFDGDGIPDSDDPDVDGDGLSNTNEVTLGTDPRNPDSDGDGWWDGVEVEAGSDPLLAASIPILFHVGEPAVGLILPTLVAQPDLANGITVAQPVVGLILPAFTEFADLTNGVVVAKPEVGLILPSFQFTEVSDGLTVAQPEVGLIVPVAPDFSSLTPGLTVAEPVVFLRLDVPTSGGAGPLSGLVLRLVQVEGAADIQALGGDSSTSGLWNVVLQWMGPNNGNYTMEASTNLHAWTPVRMEMLSAENGLFRVRCEVVAPEATFYRLRHSPVPFEK
jgi:hypothetical protein